tara:strand:+ start:107 stop:715 length:609 start_codon:yes stop_codon:yes gene_type:complete
MFYKPIDGHGLPYNPFNALIIPRPIGWISTRNGKGQDNLAPYSFFNGAAYEPPQVMFCSTGHKKDQTNTKDSMTNIRETGVFCVNIVSKELLNQMNSSSETLSRDRDEFEYAGLDKHPCKTIKCSRVALTPAALECCLTQIVKLKGQNNFAAFAEVTGIYINDDLLENGKLDVSKFVPVGRLGYRDYTYLTDLFELKRPDDN